MEEFGGFTLGLCFRQSDHHPSVADDHPPSGRRPRGSTAVAEELMVSEERQQRVVEDLGAAHLGLGD
ncbi:hypothetical protein ES288_A01G050500v1 [Gossypium darwinii]|uniref:Uncharacterized protein n=1 Tax=Gossypium darwinii TaxID=34276 RepID=A0A5D2HKM9_GOSDA|nr:hypothetical protein ES288_A01G050500v1 [Gossypium darwinii]